MLVSRKTLSLFLGGGNIQSHYKIAYEPKISFIKNNRYEFEFLKICCY